MERHEIIDFVKNMQPTDHAILLYTSYKDKHYVLFSFLKAGLEKNHAAAYITSQETPKQIRQAMKKFGIDVEEQEAKHALTVIDYRDWYIIDGKFNMSNLFRLWQNLLDETRRKGFEGLRGAGEMACFFENNMVNELIEYEYALHKTLRFPLAIICAYDSKQVTSNTTLSTLLSLKAAHSPVIIMGPKSATIIKT